MTARGRPRIVPTVDYYVCPRPFVDLGRRRTMNIAASWARRGDLSLAMLCASCYLQGIEDANTTLERKRIR